MNGELIRLAEKRGQLKARIAMQRAELAEQVWPVVEIAGAADRAVAGVHWVKRHPGAVGAGLAAFVLLRPRRAWRWARRGFVLWRGWQKVRSRVAGLASLV